MTLQCFARVTKPSMKMFETVPANAGHVPNASLVRSALSHLTIGDHCHTSIDGMTLVMC